MSLKLGFLADDLIEQGRTNRTNIEALRNWMEIQNFPGLSDEQIVRFLLSCDNDLEASKKTLTAYYHSKNELKKQFTNRDIDRPDIVQQMKTLSFAILPRRQDGCAVIFMNEQDPKAQNYDLEAQMTCSFMLLDTILYDPPPNGLIILYDVNGVGVRHLAKLKWKPLKNFFYYIQEAVPIKVKEIHVLNMFPYMHRLLNVVDFFVKQELVGKLHYYSPSEIDGVFKYIPKECLPQEYGGNLPCVATLHKETVERIRKLKPYFDSEEIQWLSHYKG